MDSRQWENLTLKKLTEKFCHIFNKFFDIFNTRSVNEGKFKKNHDLDPFSKEGDPRLKVHSIVKDFKEYQLFIVVERNISNLPKWLETMGIKQSQNTWGYFAYLTKLLKVYRYVVSLMLDNTTTI